MPQLLLASPDEFVLQAFQSSLAREGYGALEARSLGEARRALSRLRVDLLCVDTAFPPSDLVRFWRWLRSDPAQRGLPTLLVASRAAEVAEGLLPVALDGARDGVVCKPLEEEKLCQAVERLLVAGRGRREGRDLRAGPLRLAIGLRELGLPGGGGVRLTPTEFRLVRYLMERAGEIVPAEELLEQVWGYKQGTAGPEIVRAHIRNLRAKIRLAGSDPEVIRTLPGHGYGLPRR